MIRQVSVTHEPVQCVRKYIILYTFELSPIEARLEWDAPSTLLTPDESSMPFTPSSSSLLEDTESRLGVWSALLATPPLLLPLLREERESREMSGVEWWADRGRGRGVLVLAGKSTSDSL